MQLHVRALLMRTWCLLPLGRVAEQAAVVAQAETLARELGDPVILSQALRTHADYESGRGRLDVAAALADEALHWASAGGDKWEVARASRAAARAAWTTSGLGARVDRAAALLNEVGNIFDLGYLLTSAAYVALCAGCDRDARDFVERALPVVRELEHPSMWMNLQGNLGLAALLTGDSDTARDAFRQELVLSRQLVVPLITSEALLGLAALDAMRGDTRRAARLVGAASARARTALRPVAGPRERQDRRSLPRGRPRALRCRHLGRRHERRRSAEPRGRDRVCPPRTAPIDFEPHPASHPRPPHGKTSSATESAGFHATRRPLAVANECCVLVGAVAAPARLALSGVKLAVPSSSPRRTV
jgi:hypothetical protein